MANLVPFVKIRGLNLDELAQGLAGSIDHSTKFSNILENNNSKIF